jgi:hypothetical protein
MHRPRKRIVFDVPSFALVALGRIRGRGCRDRLVLCESIHCTHSAAINGDWLSDPF